MKLLSYLAVALTGICCAVGKPAVVIPLDKQYVPVHRDGKIVSYKTAYFGHIFVGAPEPQDFTVVFDTGSGHFFLPSTGCDTPSCRRHRRYNFSSSGSAKAIDHTGQQVTADAGERDQVAITFGTGEVTGDFVEETFCLTKRSEGFDHPDCTRVRVIAATQMTEEPFSSFEFDGVIGLGLASLAVDPAFSVFEQLSQNQNFVPQFGYFLSDSDDVPSEVSFGGHDERRLASDLRWSPVHKPDLGFWQVKVLSVTVGEQKLPLCSDGCVAIADTGTSLLGAPRQAAQQLHRLLARKVPAETSSDLDCRDFAGPDITFELEGGVSLVIGAREYSRAAPMQVVRPGLPAQVVCRASLLPVDQSAALGSKAFILGEPMLRKYYTVYDWQQKQVGFALSKQPVESSATHRVYGSPQDPLAPSAVHV